MSQAAPLRLGAPSAARQRAARRHGVKPVAEDGRTTRAAEAAIARVLAGRARGPRGDRAGAARGRPDRRARPPRCPRPGRTHRAPHPRRGRLRSSASWPSAWPRSRPPPSRPPAPQPFSDDEMAALQRAVHAARRGTHRGPAMIECGSLEYAQARIGARHGERAARGATGIASRRCASSGRCSSSRAPPRCAPGSPASTPTATSIASKSALRDRWRAVVAEVAGWMPARWRPALAWWAVLPDLAPLQHLARGGGAGSLDARRRRLARALRERTPGARAARLADGPLAALAAAWSAPETLPRVWQAEWRRRWPEPRREADDMLERLARAWLEHERGGSPPRRAAKAGCCAARCERSSRCCCGAPRSIRRRPSSISRCARSTSSGCAPSCVRPHRVRALGTA